MNLYYYSGDKGTNIGPLEKDELERLYSAQIIIGSTMIIGVGSDKWESYDAVFPKVDDLQSVWTPPPLMPEKASTQPIPQPSATHGQLAPVSAFSPISEGAWMAAKIVYAVLIIPISLLLYGSFLGLNSSSYYSSRSVRLNDLITYLVVAAIFVAIGFSGKIVDKRVNLKYGNGIKKDGWRGLRPVRIVIIAIIALVVGPFLFRCATA